MGSRTPDVDAFIEDGFVCLRGAFPRGIADACRALLWNEIAASPDDPSTWTEPVVRVVNMTQPPLHLVEGTGYELDGPSPVEQAIRRGLDRAQRSRRK